MNKDFFEKMDYTNKVYFAVASNSDEAISGQTITASFAYSRLEMYGVAASIQMDRIWAYIKTMNLNMPPEPSIVEENKVRDYFDSAKKLYTPLYIDIHFYFSSWDNIGKMMAVLSGQSVFQEARKVYTSHIKHLENYRSARHTFEHFDERLPGKKNEGRVREVIIVPGSSPTQNYGGVSDDDFYEFSDKRWDIKPSSLNLLQNIVSEFKEEIHKKVDLILASQ